LGATVPLAAIENFSDLKITTIMEKNLHIIVVGYKSQRLSTPESALWCLDVTNTPKAWSLKCTGSWR
jgi:hypothetical protein